MKFRMNVIIVLLAFFFSTLSPGLADNQNRDDMVALFPEFKYPIRKAQWRLAIIYLDHLGKKYPNWGDLYLAKALAFYGQDDIEKMKDALKTACSLDNQEACNDFQNINRNQE